MSLLPIEWEHEDKSDLAPRDGESRDEWFTRVYEPTRQMFLAWGAKTGVRDPEDIAQEALLKLWIVSERHFTSVQEYVHARCGRRLRRQLKIIHKTTFRPKTIRSFAWRLHRCRVIDHLRKHYRRIQIVVVEAICEEILNVEDPDTFRPEAIVRDLLEILRGIDPETFDLLVKMIEEDLSYDELSYFADCSPVALKSRVKRLREKLRVRMATIERPRPIHTRDSSCRLARSE